MNTRQKVKMYKRKYEEMKLYESYAGGKDFKDNGNANANGLLTIDRDMDNKYWFRKI